MRDPLVVLRECSKTTIESLYCTTTPNYLGEAEQMAQHKLTRPSFSSYVKKSKGLLHETNKSRWPE